MSHKLQVIYLHLFAIIFKIGIMVKNSWQKAIEDRFGKAVKEVY